MAQRKFLDDNGVRLLLQKLDQYPNNELLGTVVEAIGEELDKRPGIITYELTTITNEIYPNCDTSKIYSYESMMSSRLETIQYTFETDLNIDLSDLIKTNHIQFEISGDNYGTHHFYETSLNPSGYASGFFNKNIVIGQLISATPDTAVIAITYAEPAAECDNRQFNTLLNNTTMGGPAFYMFHMHPNNETQKNVWISDDIPLNPPPLLFTDIRNKKGSEYTKTLFTLSDIYHTTYLDYAELINSDLTLLNEQYRPYCYAPVTQEIMKYFLKKNLLNVYGFSNYKPPLLYIQELSEMSEWKLGHTSDICTYGGCRFITPSSTLAVNNTVQNQNSLKAIVEPTITEVSIDAITFYGPHFLEYTYIYDSTLNLFQRVKPSSGTSIAYTAIWT